MKADIVIRNGLVVDSSENRSEFRNIAICNGKIIGSNGCEITNETRIIDADGCYIFPGMIDFHSHLFYGGSHLGIMPDMMLSQGVTSAVDAGTAGWMNYKSFYNRVITRSELRIKAFLNVYSRGIPGNGVMSRPNPRFFREDKISQLVEAYAEHIIGLKVQIGRESVGDNGRYVLEETVALAERLGRLRVCVHVTNAGVSASEIVGILRPGDIFCHMYQGKGDAIILNDRGVICEEVIEARKRGVIFDAANGNNHFDLRIAKRALEQGFKPDVISSDFTRASICSSTRLRTFAFIMSKYMNLGVDLIDIIRAVTETPAKLMGEEGHLGTLREGAEADITIMRLLKKPCVFKDTNDDVFYGCQLLVPQLTMKGSRLLYCAADFDI